MTSILLTGGAGFMGTEISLMLANDDRFDRIVILSRDWHKHEVLKRKVGDNPKFRYMVGDILDKDRLFRAFNGIDYVVHLSAVKGVQATEYSPRETALMVNCVGTQNVIDAAIDAGVKKVLFISSDKAVDAGINTYGVSKSMGEHLIVAGNSYSPRGTKLSSCRYGNVLGSSGSVLPLFERQRESGTLTVTHEKATRFWFLPQDAVLFILKCLDEMVGGEVFVPKLPASRVIDLAKAVAPQASISIIGNRPGDKMHELMISSTESERAVDIGWAYRIEPTFRFWDSATPYPTGSSVPQGWCFSSASATRLGVPELQAMIQKR